MLSHPINLPVLEIIRHLDSSLQPPEPEPETEPENENGEEKEGGEGEAPPSDEPPAGVL